MTKSLFLRKTHSLSICFALLVASLGSIGMVAHAANHSAKGQAKQTLNSQTAANLGQTAVLQIKQRSIKVDVAADNASLTRGLRYRQSLPTDTGMLFLLPFEGKHCFWTKNTYIPISIAYINRQGVITDIFDMQALDETPVCSTKNIPFALEAPLGWFKQHGIGVGQTVMIK